jgi:hypothetical protein
LYSSCLLSLSLSLSLYANAMGIAIVNRLLYCIGYGIKNDVARKSFSSFHSYK